MSDKQNELEGKLTFTELHENDITHDVKPISGEELTSVYEENQKVTSFSGLNLFYFLLHNGYAAFLPFFSIYLSAFGFNFSQIGVLTGLCYLVSGLCGPVWYFITEHYDSRKPIMIISMVSWVIFFIPAIFLPNETTKFNLCTENVSTNDLTYVNKNVEHDFSKWHQLDYAFILFCGLMVCGRVFQSSTDYFYSYHRYLITTNEVYTNNKEFKFGWKVSASLICIATGYFLDTIEMCSIRFGQFKISFYIFALFISFACIILNFLDVNQYQVATKRKIKSYQVNQTYGWFIIHISLLTISVSHGISMCFLYLRMHSVHGLFVQIGLAYFIYKCTSSVVEEFRIDIIKTFGIYEVLFFNLCTGAIRNLYFGYIQSEFDAWFIIPMELLSGFHVLLHASATNHFKNTSFNRISFEKQYHITYWVIGFPIGTVGFGFICDLLTEEDAFHALAFLNLFICIIVVLTYCTNRGPDDEKSTSERQQNNDDSEDDAAEFLKNVTNAIH